MSSNVCGYCHGVRLVGWSGAGPILCRECSTGQDAFTVITQAWREQRAMVWEREAELSEARATILGLGMEVEHYEEQRDETKTMIRRLRVERDELLDAAGLACECPPTGCDCAGCSYGREVMS